MSAHWVRFGGFRIDLETGDLLGDAGPVAIQPLPARLLVLLVSGAGAMVTRDEIKQRIWGETTFAADQALNAAIRQIRIALGDSATKPRFVATVPRRGYRFAAELAPDEGPHVAKEPAADDEPAGAAGESVVAAAEPIALRIGARSARRPSRGLLAAVAVVLVAAFLGIDQLTGSRGGAERASPLRGAADLPSDIRLEYLKARELLDGPDTTAWQGASVAFETVREREPGFMPATSGASHAALRLGELERAAGLAAWALAADSLNGEANMVLGTTLLLRGEWDPARVVLQRARYLAPDLVPVYTGLATLEALDGRLDAAFRHAETALEVDPMSAITLGDAGYVALWTERPERALEWCGHALDLRPDWNTPRYCILDAHHVLGRAEAERATAVDIMRKLDAAPAAVREVAASPAADGLRTYRAWQIERLDPDGAEPPELAAYLAFLHMQDGNRDAVLRLLRVARQADPVGFRLTLLDPVFEALREDPSLRRPAVATTARW